MTERVDVEKISDKVIGEVACRGSIDNEVNQWARNKDMEFVRPVGRALPQRLLRIRVPPLGHRWVAVGLGRRRGR